MQAALPTEPHSFWTNLVGAGEDDPHSRYSLMATLFGDCCEVSILLRYVTFLSVSVEFLRR